MEALDTLDKTLLEYGASVVFWNIGPFLSAELQEIHCLPEPVD